MSDISRTPWSVDIVKQAQYHISFLKTVDDVPALHHEPHIRNAVRRYECMWLPLLARNQGAALEPPLDIHWVWHCHILSPKAYHQDCRKLIGFVPDHELRLIRAAFTEATQRASTLWAAMFPHEPFCVDLNVPPAASTAEFTSSLSYNLAAAAQRQQCFYYNVSLPHFTDITFLITASERYAKFLHLKKNNPKAFIVPMYDVDLMWHTHQLFPHAYLRDTTNLLGFLLNHDDDTTDRSPGSKLATSDAETRELWKKTYQEDFPIAGVMYRGESPVGKLFLATVRELQENIPVKGHVQLEQVTLSGAKDKYKITGSMTVNTLTRKIDLAKKKGPGFSWTHGLPSVSVTTKKNGISRITAKFTRHDGLRHCFIGTDICKATFNANTMLNAVRHTDQKRRVVLKSSVDHYNVEIQAMLSKIQADRQSLSISWKPFAEYTMPEDVQQLWGPVQLPKLSEGMANTCNVASHIVSVNGVTAFTVRVIHSLPLKMSVIQVFYKDKMAASSQLIGSEQLPRPNQVALKDQCVTLDGKKGERAMLIKSCKGDWGIVKGYWTGVKRGTRQVKGNPGYLQAKLFKLGATKKAATFTLMKGPGESRVNSQDDQVYSMKFRLFGEDGITVSMAENEVEVGTDCKEVAELLAGAFSAAVLVLLCEPQPHVFLNKGKPTMPPSSRRGRESVNHYGCHNVSFFFYCGYMEPMYTNSWIYWHFSLAQGSCAWGVDWGLGGGLDGGLYGPDGVDGVGGDSPVCPWDPDGTADHSNDTALAESGGDAAAVDTAAMCGGCGSCATSGGGGGGGCVTSGDGGGCGTSGDGGGCGATSSGCGSSCGSSCGGGCGGGCGG